MRSKEAICMIGLLRHSTHSEDSPDAVLAFEGSLSVRETQGRAWPCDQGYSRNSQPRLALASLNTVLETTGLCGVKSVVDAFISA